MPTERLQMKAVVFNKSVVQGHIKKQIILQRKRIQSLVRYYGYLIMKRAKERCPVDTGRLKKSISVKLEDRGFTAFIHTYIIYAPDQEFTTWYNHTVGEWGYLRKALRDYEQPFKNAIRSQVIGG